MLYCMYACSFALSCKSFSIADKSETSVPASPSSVFKPAIFNFSDVLQNASGCPHPASSKLGRSSIPPQRLSGRGTAKFLKVEGHNHLTLCNVLAYILLFLCIEAVEEGSGLHMKLCYILNLYIWLLSTRVMKRSSALRQSVHIHSYTTLLARKSAEFGPVGRICD